MNVINCYGERESHNSKDSIKENWLKVVSEIKRMERLNEGIILASDLNKHVGDIIKGNKDKVTPGGKMIRDLIDNDKYVLLNASKNVVEGPFTRYETTNPDDEN